ncbi:hypothetical protein EYF80_003596 [Liparis tanakae]|uniref:Uncharacterized protein n=1 Tax=Liparis tanakae TaxID=230148 RepID=A0A4Z2J7L7_9TELE|nr:hypothetical protein EYF80_003596 [Liparis tanakae]
MSPGLPRRRPEPPIQSVSIIPAGGGETRGPIRAGGLAGPELGTRIFSTSSARLSGTPPVSTRANVSLGCPHLPSSRPAASANRAEPKAAAAASLACRWPLHRAAEQGHRRLKPIDTLEDRSSPMFKRQGREEGIHPEI